jgi:hypothetical protein
MSMTNFKTEKNGWCYAEGDECVRLAKAKNVELPSDGGVTTAAWVGNESPAQKVLLKGLFGCPGCRGVGSIGEHDTLLQPGSENKYSVLCMSCGAMIEVTILVRGSSRSPVIFALAKTAQGPSGSRLGIHLEELTTLALDESETDHKRPWWKFW